MGAASAGLAADPTPVSESAPTQDSANDLVRDLTGASSKTGLLQWHNIKLFPRATVSALSDDNINIQTTAQESDIIWSLSPGGTILAGDPGVPIPEGTTVAGLRMLPRQPYFVPDAQPAKMFLLDYAPTFKYFDSHTQFDNVDEAALMTGVYSFSRLTLGLDQDYVKSKDVIYDVGSRTLYQNLNTRVTSKYDLTDRTSVEVNGEYRNTSYQETQLTGSREWVNQDWVNRQVFSKVTAGVGLRFEYWDINRNPSQTAEQVLARAVYYLAEKLQFTISVGPEWRQYASGSPGTLDPVLSLSATYHPRDSETVTLEGHRYQQVSASTGNENYTLTGFGIGIQQRFAARWFLGVSGGYDTAEYHATTPAAVATRTDNYLTGRIGLDYRFTGHWNAGLFYLYRGDSPAQGAGYKDDQVGAQVSWAFW